MKKKYLASALVAAFVLLMSLQLKGRSLGEIPVEDTLLFDDEVVEVDEVVEAIDTGSFDSIATIHLFLSAPSVILPTLPSNTRLDMVDYFNSSMPNSSKNIMGGVSNIEEATDQSIKIKMSVASECQIFILPYGKQELYGVIKTVYAPEADSKLEIYNTTWGDPITSKIFKSPALSDWLNAVGQKHKKEVANALQFMLVSYSYDPATQQLTLINNSRTAFSKETYEPIASYLKERIVYQWNGKKFVKQ
ncbi:MAG: DUF3256 family protein [Bacteroides sp.]|nr:DUF3256 family protein [Bacteroides sp.]MCM1413641.1 DUF3256 family protein [Bacteroides sp.]MCM1471142.1 DUF3256 family protein [Bacteroides sp.]